MRVLIVDDDPIKVASIKDAFARRCSDSVRESFEVAGDLSTAVRLMAVSSYDMIVLDLMLPYVSGGVAAAGAGIELLKQVRSIDGLNLHSAVVGLSAHPEEVMSARDHFEQHGVLLIEYDSSGRWRISLSQIRDDVVARMSPIIDLDFLIVVALQKELEGLRSTNLAFKDVGVRNGLNVQFVELAENGVRHGAVVLLRQMGLATAALDTAVALRTFKVPIVCMTGICAGLSGEVELGQVVLATPAWEYQSGKWANDDFQIAPYQVSVPPATRVIAEQVLRRTNIEDLERGISFELRRPSTRTSPTLAPGATGSAVIADVKRLAHIEKQHRKLAVIDMETFGIYLASHESAAHVPHFFSIKTVVDLADEGKGDDLHEYGCIVSARVATSLISAIFAAA